MCGIEIRHKLNLRNLAPVVKFLQTETLLYTT